MISLQRHEGFTLVYDKLISIRDVCDGIDDEQTWFSAERIAELRHKLSEVSRLALRACEVIDKFEPAEDISSEAQPER